MRKLLSLVLSISILASSVTPSLAQLGPIGRRGAGNFLRSVGAAGQRALTTRLSAQITRQVAKSTVAPSALQRQILAGNVKGLAGQILQFPKVQQAPILRNEFVTLSLIPNAVTPAQRAQAVKTYKAQLKNTREVLAVPAEFDKFLEYAKENPTNADVTAVRNILADASALGLVGSKEDAPALLDFYNKSQGSPFQKTAALITGHGLLRMQAYDELGKWLNELVNPSDVLSGVIAYIERKGLPVEIDFSYLDRLN